MTSDQMLVLVIFLIGYTITVLIRAAIIARTERKSEPEPEHKEFSHHEWMLENDPIYAEINAAAEQRLARKQRASFRGDRMSEWVGRPSPAPLPPRRTPTEPLQPLGFHEWVQSREEQDI